MSKNKAFSSTCEICFIKFAVCLLFINQSYTLLFESRCKDKHKTNFLLLKNHQLCILQSQLCKIKQPRHALQGKEAEIMRLREIIG